MVTLKTNVGKGESIVLNVTRALAPNGVDHFLRLAKAGFFNNSAFFRYDPNRLVEWGVSGNSSLNHQFGHTPIQNDPVKESNLYGTLTFNINPEFKVRSTVLFLNLGNNSHLDSEGFAPFATVVGDGMKTVEAIHNPTPNSTEGASPQAYADNGNAWVEKTYPGINFITGVEINEGL